MTGGVLDGGQDHAVVFYERDEELVDAVIADLAPGLADGASAIVVATAAHRRAFEAALAGRGLDLDAHRQAGTYVALDAATTLARILVDGHPDPAQIGGLLGGVVADAARRGRGVRVFGEMVALLWARGDVDAAIELEERWNDLARTEAFTLLCAYPMRSVEQVGDLGDTDRLCRQHAAIVPPASYERGTVPGGGPDSGGVRERLFVPVPLAARAVRCFVRRAVEDWGCAEACGDDAELVASELAGNALVHARSPFRVSVARRGGGVRLSVRDAEPEGQPQVVRAEDDATSGRGVAIVAALAERWGVLDGVGGKTVWADVLPAPA